MSYVVNEARELPKASAGLLATSCAGDSSTSSLKAANGHLTDSNRISTQHYTPISSLDLGKTGGSYNLQLRNLLPAKRLQMATSFVVGVDVGSRSARAALVTLKGEEHSVRGVKFLLGLNRALVAKINLKPLQVFQGRFCYN